MERIPACSSGFNARLVCLGCFVDKLALERIFLRVLRFSPVNIIPPVLQSYSFAIDVV